MGGSGGRVLARAPPAMRGLLPQISARVRPGWLMQRSMRDGRNAWPASGSFSLWSFSSDPSTWILNRLAVGFSGDLRHDDAGKTVHSFPLPTFAALPIDHTTPRVG